MFHWESRCGGKEMYLTSCMWEMYSSLFLQFHLMLLRINTPHALDQHINIIQYNDLSLLPKLNIGCIVLAQVYYYYCAIYVRYSIPSFPHSCLVNWNQMVAMEHIL